LLDPQICQLKILNTLKKFNSLFIRKLWRNPKGWMWQSIWVNIEKSMDKPFMWTVRMGNPHVLCLIISIKELNKAQTVTPSLAFSMNLCTLDSCDLKLVHKTQEHLWTQWSHKVLYFFIFLVYPKFLFTPTGIHSFCRRLCHAMVTITRVNSLKDWLQHHKLFTVGAFVGVSLFYTSLIFLGKIEANPSGGPQRTPLQRQAALLQM
jgi:hypothetical protein